MKRFSTLVLTLLVSVVSLSAQGTGSLQQMQHYGAEPLRFNSLKEWRKVYRPAIYNFFLTEVYGRQPEQQLPVCFELLEQSDEALGGKATRKQVAIHITPQRGTKLAEEGYEHTILLLIYQPNNTRKAVPAFVAMNFKEAEHSPPYPPKSLTEPAARPRPTHHV